MAARSLMRNSKMQKIAVGIDLGGTRVRAALVDQQGMILARTAESTDAMAGPQRVLSQIQGLADGLLASMVGADVVGIGVCAPGPLDTVAGIATHTPTLCGFSLAR